MVDGGSDFYVIFGVEFYFKEFKSGGQFVDMSDSRS